jgi:hypothetical protein
MAFIAHFRGGDCSVTGSGETIQSALDHATSQMDEACFASYPNPLEFEADGESNMAFSGYGSITDYSGNFIPAGFTEYILQAPGTDSETPLPDSSFSFIAAAGLVALFALGYIGGHQR